MTGENASHSIVIVDDEPTMVKSLADFLKDRHFDVTTFTDSVRARDVLHTTNFDSALLDITMPDVDGVELARIARAKNPGGAIIFMTGLSPDAELADRLASIGETAMLLKPFDLRDLLRLLKRER